MENEHMTDLEDEEFEVDSDEAEYRGKMTRMTEMEVYRSCISAVPILTQNVILCLMASTAATTALMRMVTSS